MKPNPLNETHNINGVEIFAPGKWNGDEYTEADVKSMADAFQATKDALKPYVKLGHSEGQTLLSEDELPAAGWISKVYMKGSKLVADFVDMPKKVYELVKARAYKRVSSEIFVNVTVNGKKYPFALKAVALLGGETPAVQTLDDIHALYALDQSVLAFAKEAEVRAYQFDSAKKEDAMPEDKPSASPEAKPEVKDHAFPGAPQPGFPGAAPAMPHPGMPPAAPAAGPQCNDPAHAKMAQELMALKQRMGIYETDATSVKAELEQAKKEFVKVKTELDASQKALSERSAELKKIEAAKSEAEVNVQVDKFVADKKVLPAQAAFLKTLLLSAKESGIKKFKVGDKEIEGVEALVLEFVNVGQAGLSTAPKSEAGKAIAVPDETDGKAKDAAIKEYMAKSGEKSYSKAYAIVVAELAKSQPKKD